MPIGKCVSDDGAEVKKPKETPEEKKERLRREQAEAVLATMEPLLMRQAGEDADRRPEPIDYVLPGLPRGDVGAIIAAGGVGKSFFAMQLGYSLACPIDITGGFFGPLDRRKVLYVAREDGKQALLYRKYVLRESLYECATEDQKKQFFIQHGANYYSLNNELKTYLTDNFITLNADGLQIDVMDESWQDAIKLFIFNNNIDLLILDTLRLCHTSDENDSSAMTKLIFTLKDIAYTQGCSVLFLHHTNKSSVFGGMSGSVAQASRGSSVLVDNIRWQINLATMTPAEAQGYVETRFDDDDPPQIDRKDITCISCTKINHGERFEDCTYEKDAHGALRRIYLTQCDSKSRKKTKNLKKSPRINSPQRIEKLFDDEED